MKITEYLESIGVTAERTYNTTSIRLFKDGSVVGVLEGSELSKRNTPELTLEYIKEVLKDVV